MHVTIFSSLDEIYCGTTNDASKTTRTFQFNVLPRPIRLLSGPADKIQVKSNHVRLFNAPGLFETVTIRINVSFR